MPRVPVRGCASVDAMIQGGPSGGYQSGGIIQGMWMRCFIGKCQPRLVDLSLYPNRDVASKLG